MRECENRIRVQINQYIWGLQHEVLLLIKCLAMHTKREQISRGTGARRRGERQLRQWWIVMRFTHSRRSKKTRIGKSKSIFIPIPFTFLYFANISSRRVESSVTSRSISRRTGWSKGLGSFLLCRESGRKQRQGEHHWLTSPLPARLVSLTKRRLTNVNKII